MSGRRRAISLFRRKVTTEYFDCAQFDRVSRIVGVGLAVHYRYCLKSHLANRALTSHKAKLIQFDKRWFLQLSPSARCAVLVHELWHVTLLKKAARMKWLRRLYTYVAVPTLSFFAVWAPVVLVSDLTRGAGNFSGLAVLFFPVFVLLGYLYVNRLWKWPFEYECDEAAVRFMGASPTREFLRTFRLKSGWRSHPPARKRLERVDEETSRFPVPVINFASLQRDVRQEFVFK